MTIKNYAEQGGDKWVVSGTLEIKAEGELILGSVPLSRAVEQEKSDAATIAELKTNFNELIAKLQAAGLMDKPHG
ncbi:hypothetical protein SOV_35720 [Sporomusa ovata DSM 2662]|uniref:Head fiber protein n=1 Tax=Sporomusa ovata TaxID=2378 RepID=A0A0U1L5V2_9FIRM|nr:hypothetical protein [Sporomusa ovata]EQB24618.1 hypothetical protein SOV_6c00320 [Sporomusa ovata DSM 2662]EQB24722.1 hypothetical protein SOV_6c01360 [Sporomusa ovata DSM 2662]CQR75067.1 hypothetical protein SpAn4DRAFT_4431 [Sporomusa ovata]